MNFQVDVSQMVTSPTPAEPPAAPPPSEAVDLLRQILEVQKELLAQQKAAAQAHDMSGRWRAFLARWKDDFPGLGGACRHSLPVLERVYAKLIADLTDLCQDGDDPLETDFALQEFLDRFGMRLAQLGTIINLVAPLAEAGPPPEAPS
jgi:hypothetical protein